MLNELSLLHANARVVVSDTLTRQLHELMSHEDRLFQRVLDVVSDFSEGIVDEFCVFEEVSVLLTHLL